MSTILHTKDYQMAAIICASGQRRFVELFLLKLIKGTVKKNFK